MDFFVIEIIPFQSYHDIIFIAEKGIFMLLRLHQHQYLFASKMLQMYSGQKFRHLQSKLRSGEKPAHDLLIFEVLLLRLMNLFPYFNGKVYVILSRFHILRDNGTFNKKIQGSSPVLRFPCKHRCFRCLFFRLFF